MSRRVWIRRTFLATAVLVVALGALYGPLFAWSPVRPGFTTVSTKLATIRYRSSTALALDPNRLTTSLSALQDELGLRFTGPIDVILCDQWSDLTRFTPWLRLSPGVGAITLPIGLITYVTPTVRNRSDLATFITHEGSHSLLYQHASIRHRLAMERQAWLVEGIGAHFGNPDSYELRDEFERDAASHHVPATIDPEAPGHIAGLGGFRFAYSAYGFFVDFLIERFGAQRFQQFVEAYVAEPDAYRSLFAHVYGLSFSDAISSFADTVGHSPKRATPGR